MANSSSDPESYWQYGFKDYHGVLVRFVLAESIDPTVAIEKFANQNNWFYKLVTGISPDQPHFGFDYLETPTHEVDPTQIEHLDTLEASDMLSIVEGIAVMSVSSRLSKTSAEPPQARPFLDPNLQLQLFKI